MSIISAYFATTKTKVRKKLHNSSSAIWPVHSSVWKLDSRVNVNLFGLENISPASSFWHTQELLKLFWVWKAFDLALGKLYWMWKRVELWVYTNRISDLAAFFEKLFVFADPCQ